MSYGLIQSGRSMKGEAMQGLSDVARNNEQRKQTNQSLKDAKRAQETSAIASGATMGFLAGGPAGAALGALAGWALS